DAKTQRRKQINFVSAALPLCVSALRKVTIVFGILACLSFALYIWQFFLGMRFRYDGEPSTTAFPGITILKPLKGCDSETEACLRTWLEQDYPGPMQVLFG